MTRKEIQITNYLKGKPASKKVVKALDGFKLTQTSQQEFHAEYLGEKHRLIAPTPSQAVQDTLMLICSRAFRPDIYYPDQNLAPFVANKEKFAAEVGYGL